MPTSTHEVLALAQRLQTEVDNEAALRSSVSRSYYAALLWADETFAPRDPLAQRVGESSHEKIIARAQVHGIGANPGRSAAMNVAKLLPKMKRIRVIADYHLDDTVSPQQCDEAMLRAESVMVSCDEVIHKMQQAADAPAVTAPTCPPRPALTRTK